MNVVWSIIEDKNVILANQLIKEAKTSFGFDIDQSKIQTIKTQNDGNEDIITSVQLSNSVDTTNMNLKRQSGLKKEI